MLPKMSCHLKAHRLGLADEVPPPSCVPRPVTRLSVTPFTRNSLVAARTRELVLSYFDAQVLQAGKIKISSLEVQPIKYAPK